MIYSKFYFLSLLFFVFIFARCGNKLENTASSVAENKISDNKNSDTKKLEIIDAPEIAGTYSGTDNVGMESSIILNRGGTLTVYSSVGDGTPAFGKWSGEYDNLSLYISDEFGDEHSLGSASVTKRGLQLIGGNFYKRQ